MNTFIFFWLVNLNLYICPYILKYIYIYIANPKTLNKRIFFFLQNYYFRTWVYASYNNNYELYHVNLAFIQGGNHMMIRILLKIRLFTLFLRFFIFSALIRITVTSFVLLDTLPYQSVQDSKN